MTVTTVYAAKHEISDLDLGEIQLDEHTEVKAKKTTVRPTVPIVQRMTTVPPSSPITLSLSLLRWLTTLRQGGVTSQDTHVDKDSGTRV